MKINRAKNPNSMDYFEKEHTPSIEIISDKVIVKVGREIEHPMNPDHFITNIELFSDGEKIASKNLDDEDDPAATFNLENTSAKNGKLVALANCNLHGTWESI